MALRIANSVVVAGAAPLVGQISSIVCHIAPLCWFKAKKSPARKNEFREPIQSDLGRPVPSQEIIHFSFAPKRVFLFASRLTRGAYRDRHGRGARDAVDAAASARER